MNIRAVGEVQAVLEFHAGADLAINQLPGQRVLTHAAPRGPRRLTKSRRSAALTPLTQSVILSFRSD